MSHSDVIIDLSHHNAMTGTFADLRQAGILAVIHKAASGLGEPDPVYLERRQEAMEAGLYWGAYHLGLDNGGGAAQADSFLGIVRSGNPRWKTLLALDYERTRGGVLPAMRPEDAEEFVTRIHELAGFYPVVYGRTVLMETVALKPGSPLARCPLWIAHYEEGEPKVPQGWDRWAIWQYTEAGACGQLSPCDRDRFNGEEKDLAAFWEAHSV